MTRLLCLGIAVQDFVFQMDTLPVAATKYRASDMRSVGGGCAATAAVAVARLGGQALLATRLGDDAIADVIVAELEGHGVDCTHARRFDGRRSSLSAVIVDAKGERMIVNYLDPDLSADADWLPDPRELGIAAVLADTRWPAGSAAMLAAARTAGLPAVLDADTPVPDDDGLLGAATHIAFSEPGLASLFGPGDVRQHVRQAAERTGAWVCVTTGEDGVVIADRAGTRTIPAFPVSVRDTLGAGDVWHGAFALALGEGMPEIDAVRFASAAAALKCTRFGGRTGVPSRTETDAFLKLHSDEVA